MQNTTKKQMSSQAQVAKLCRQYLKGLSIKCKAKSDSFSMGDSVDVTVYDQNPEMMKKINEELGQYQYGHFDGMTDREQRDQRSSTYNKALMLIADFQVKH